MAEPPVSAHGPALNLALNKLRSAVGSVRAEQRRASDEVAAVNAELRSVVQGLNRALASQDHGGAERLERRRQDLLARREAALSHRRALDDRVRAEISNYDRLIDPGDADGTAPLLLLPVRLETRYLNERTLRIRIFPDDIHVDGLERGMSDAEQAAARTYWADAWTADPTGAETAWRRLQASVGKERALWIALGSEPSNLARRGIDVAPILPAIAKPSGRPAVARLLPDHFMAIAIQGGQQSTALGNPLGTDVCVTPFANDGRKPATNGAPVIADAKWLVDYGEAVKIGLGITLSLARPGHVDRLFVFGVRRSLDPVREAPDALADLLRAHRCASGLAFVPPGTPTNNTEAARAGVEARSEPGPPARDVPSAPPPGSNADVLGEALGVDPRRLAELDYGLSTDQADARAMNVALWGPSWGEFLKAAQTEGNKGEGLTQQGIEDVRILHRDFVRGRGPLPAVRVGDQPYGVLPASISALWKPERRDRTEAELLGLLKRLRSKWQAALPKIPRVGGQGAIDKTMQALLGSAPVSFAAHVRSILSGPGAYLSTKVTGASESDLALDQLVDSLIWEDMSNRLYTRPPRVLEKDPRTLPLPYVDERDVGFIAALLGGTYPGEPTSVLQALLALAWDRSRRQADDEAGVAELATRSEWIPSVHREALAGLYGRADTAHASEFFEQLDQVSRGLGIQARPSSAYHPIPGLQRSFRDMAVSATSEAARKEYIGQGVVGWLGATGRHAELREALEQLVKIESLELRHILVAETLDTASHRLDAWITALVERRRRANRKRQPGAVTIGAYGWVEDIEPRRRPAADGGYIHAPSISHAVTAGILRSAYLSHNPDSGGDGAFAVDLASARVRLALELLDGIRQNQPLGALLGYRIERAVRNGHATRLILSLRTLAPLLPGKLSDRNQPIGDSAIEALAATNVVDGIALLEKFKALPNLRAILGEPPKNNPYFAGVTWAPLSDGEWNAVVGAIKEAEAALDAVADLLLAEGVHQLTQGNVERAAAVMDTASGDAAPPDPEFIATPSLGVPIVHQLLLLANGGVPWNLTRPRAAAEPALEAWAASVLGDPDAIAVATLADGTRLTARDSGLCALDFVYFAEDQKVFDARVRAALRGRLTAPTPLAETGEVDWPAGTRSLREVFHLAVSMRALLAKARPIVPGDVAPPGTVPGRSAPAAEVQAAHLRVSAAVGALTARGQAVQALVDANSTDAALLAPVLEELAAFGIAVPNTVDERLPTVAAMVAAEAARRVITATAELDAATSVEAITQAGQSVFGDGFWVLPGLTSGAQADAWDTAFAAAPTGASRTAVRRFLIDRASVRDGARRLVEVELLAEAAGNALTTRAGQLISSNGIGPRRWIALPLEPDEATPSATILNTVAIAASEIAGTASIRGLVVDQWTEVLPEREAQVDPETQGRTIKARHTTGIALNADAPGARAPQALLLGVSPDGARWNAERILALLQETLELAKLRLVTLETTVGVARVLPALYTRTWSLQGDPVLKFGVVSQLIKDTSLVTFLKDSP